jgi:AcrR family transcriptional regulator
MNSAQTANQTAAEPRHYTSPLRERQTEQTRETILQALTDELADGGLQELNIPGLARRAGVSVRTVYRYFPDKEALLDAAEQWMDDRIAPGASPVSADDMATSAEQIFAAFDANESVMLAQWATAVGRVLRAKGRKRRLGAYEAALREVTSDLSRADARAALAILSYLRSSWTWKTLRDEFGMSGAESGKAVAWALRTLIADLRKRNEAAVTNDTQPLKET